MSSTPSPPSAWASRRRRLRGGHGRAHRRWRRGISSQAGPGQGARGGRDGDSEWGRGSRKDPGAARAGLHRQLEPSGAPDRRRAGRRRHPQRRRGAGAGSRSAGPCVAGSAPGWPGPPVARRRRDRGLSHRPRQREGRRRRYRWDEHISAGAAHARPIPDEIARRFVFAGTAAEVAQMVRRLEGCGVTHVLALLMGSDIAGTLEAWSREITPAWRTPSMAGR